MLLSNENFFILILPMFFLAIFLFCFGLFQYLIGKKRQRTNVSKIKAGGYGPGEKRDNEHENMSPLNLKGKNNLLVHLLALFYRGPKRADYEHDVLDLKFLKAGIQYPGIAVAFMGAKLILPIIFIIIFIVLRLFFFKIMTDPVTITALVCIGLFGFYLPDIWLRQKTGKRKQRLFRGLPDALDLLVVCVEAGMGMDSAILKVAEETEKSYPDLSQEFTLMNLELRAGKTRQDALRSLSSRTGIDEMNSLVTLLIQTDKFGTSVSTALRVFSDSFRTKRFQMAEEIAAKLPVKILIPLILFIFPALFIVLLGPAAITIYKNIIKVL